MTVEELRGMTHEDLVRRVQELEEANEKLAEEKNTWYKSWSAFPALADWRTLCHCCTKPLPKQ